ncbi:MAG: D-amino-acid transaminase [Alphaproteobacteria bacterium]
MSRIAYVNGRYVPHMAAQVHVEDRGYQFADGVYEVIAVVGGRLVDGGPHLDRLERSLGELDMAMPMARGALNVVMGETVRRNGVGDGIVYLQVTRGVARRNHPFPDGVRPALVITARHMTFPHDSEGVTGGKVISAPDIRWKRCDIKSVSLLPNVLAKQQAVAAGAHETWMVDGDGFVTEGSATNAWILDREGCVVTRPKGNAILGGITRETLLRLARQAGMKVVERPFTIDEAKAAREAFFTSTTNLIKPVTEIDDAVIGNGVPGETSRRLLGLYLAYARGETRACA